MKASETNLQIVLEGEKQYVVPLFQRPYSWLKRRWQDLWDDLLELYESDDMHSHFIGAVVTMPVDMSPTGINKFLLIDGQQRLTTIFMILAVIRDLSSSTNQQLAEKINEQYLINRWGAETNRFKLLPTQANRASFFQLIEGKPQDEGTLREAYSYYERRLKGTDTHKQPLDLQRFCTVLIQQLSLVSIVLQKDENPHNIFESLNVKGEPLTQADLVRNYFLMRIDDEAEQNIAYRDYWQPMEVSLNKELTNFMWRYLNKDGTFNRQNAIYDAFKKRLASKTRAEVVDTLLEMHTYAGCYRKLIDPDQEPDREVRRRLHRLNRWEINTAYPFLLALYDDYAQHHITAAQMSTALEMIESYVIRRFFCNIPTNALNRIFIALYRSLKHDDLIGSLQTQLLAHRWPDDREFLAGWAKFPIYRSGTDKVRHILESLETALTRNNEPVDLSFSRITIEHIMPQTLNEVWEEALGSEAAITHANYLHSIGNLTLTGKNEPMGNISFSSKKPFFASSNLALNKYFAHTANWNATAISQRALDLGQIALTIWPCPQAQVTALSDDDPTGYKPTGFTLFGTHYEVHRWREMLLQVCELLAKRHGEAHFAALATQVTGTTRQYVRNTSEGMINPAAIPGTQLWIETNQSSRSVLWVIAQIMDALGYTETDFTGHW